LPATGLQRLRVVVVLLPASSTTLSTEDEFQSLIAISRLSSQLEVMLSITLIVFGLLERAQ
jgi:hypothetical protein